MLRKPRVIRESLSPVTVKVAELIALEVDARVGPNATFEESEDAASAVAAEVAVVLAAKAAARGQKVGG
jgi:hypothetical protein